MSLEQEIRDQIENIKKLKLSVGEINNHLSALEGLCRDSKEESYQRRLDDAHRISEEAYQAGLNDAWETARTLIWDTSIYEYMTAGINTDDWDNETCEVLRRYPAHEAVELLRTIKNSGQPKSDLQKDIERFVKNANAALNELAKRFAENIKDIDKYREDAIASMRDNDT